MPRANIAHKHYRLDEAKIIRAQAILGTKTETETIERALEQIIAEDERERRVRKAHDKFLKSGIQIRDVYGNLEN
ncbi:MAG TPA: hypothetical protein VLX58_13150 [Bryobacteraceae bacterium]|nr:hypothetical protein [Bryobacteraceae bacterium]